MFGEGDSGSKLLPERAQKSGNVPGLAWDVSWASIDLLEGK